MTEKRRRGGQPGNQNKRGKKSNATSNPSNPIPEVVPSLWPHGPQPPGVYDGPSLVRQRL